MTNTRTDQDPEKKSLGQFLSQFLTIHCLRLPPDLTWDEWVMYGGVLKRVHRSFPFYIGDWLNFGEHTYGEKFAQGIEIFNHLPPKKIMNYASVTQHVDASRRRERLSFEHHAEVAYLRPEDQEFWLELAERHGWGRSKLRREIKELP